MPLFRFVALIAPSARFALLPALALATLAVAVPAAHAQVVFDNGAPDGVNAVASDPNVPQFAAETFTLGASTSFDTVHWFGTYAFGGTPPATDAFTIAFYDTTGDIPNATPLANLTFTAGNAVNRTLTQATVEGFDIFQYSSALSGPVTLGPGTYGIGIVNDTTSDPDDDWAWATSSRVGAFFVRRDTSATYDRVPGGNLAFRLINSAEAVAAPEPGSIALLLSTLR